MSAKAAIAIFELSAHLPFAPIASRWLAGASRAGVRPDPGLVFARPASDENSGVNFNLAIPATRAMGGCQETSNMRFHTFKHFTTITAAAMVAFSGLALAKISQTITLTTPSSISIPALPFVAGVKVTSGLPVTLTSNSPSICTVSGLTVTLHWPGICSLTAAQAGNASYAPVWVTRNTTVTVSPGATFCPPGKFPGGFYDPSESWCENGAVVPHGDSLCLPGTFGPGGVYDPSRSTCDSGVIVPFGASYCRAGSWGPGGLFDPSRDTCENGVVLPFGDLFCPAGSQGKGGIYDPSRSSCASGRIEFP